MVRPATRHVPGVSFSLVVTHVHRKDARSRFGMAVPLSNCWPGALLNRPRFDGGSGIRACFRACSRKFVAGMAIGEVIRQTGQPMENAWVTERQPGALTLSEDDPRVLAAWAADCAERALSLFEAETPSDTPPREHPMIRPPSPTRAGGSRATPCQPFGMAYCDYQLRPAPRACSGR